MRAAKIILKIVLGLLLVASITLNVILGCSSTNRLIFGDSLDARISLYHNAKRQLDSEDNFKNYTLRKETSSKNDDGDVEESVITLSCETNGENVQNCGLISEIRVNSEVTQNVYMPGNGKTYFIEGETKYFVVDEINNPYKKPTYLEDLATLGNLVIDVDLWNAEQKKLVKEEKLRPQMSINTAVKFDFNTLSFLKESVITFITPILNEETNELEDSVETLKFKFDKYDRLIEHSHEKTLTNTYVSYKITYESTKLYFPDFKNFVEKEVE